MSFVDRNGDPVVTSLELDHVNNGALTSDSKLVLVQDIDSGVNLRRWRCVVAIAKDGNLVVVADKVDGTRAIKASVGHQGRCAVVDVGVIAVVFGTDP